MAEEVKVVEQKPAKEEKPNRIKQFMNTEYKFENILLVILSLFAIVFGALILTDAFTIPEGAFLVGSYGDVFAWILIGLGAVSLLLWAIPFYRPSISEIKHIKGYKKSEFLFNILKTVVFTLILAILFFLFDLLIESIISWIK